MDLDRLHKIYLGEVHGGRGIGYSTAVVYQALGFASVLINANIFILTNNNVDNLKWLLQKAYSEQQIQVDYIFNYSPRHFVIGSNKLYILQNEGIYNKLDEMMRGLDNIMLLFDFSYNNISICSAQLTWEEYNQLYAGYMGRATLGAMKNMFGGGNVEINVNLW